jgi:hypothetical protein
VLRHLVNVVRAAVHERNKSARRSPRWDEVRDKTIAKVGACEACGEKKNLQVHHEKPFHLHPELELDPANLIVLCMGHDDCHLLLGHGGSFASYDPLVREHVLRYRAVVDEHAKMLAAGHAAGRVASPSEATKSRLALEVIREAAKQARLT